MGLPLGTIRLRASLTGNREPKMNSGAVEAWKESKRFFFEKKKQKTFAKLDRAGFTTWGLVSKSFLVTFFQKSNHFLLTSLT
jgi:hypothetical protein